MDKETLIETKQITEKSKVMDILNSNLHLSFSVLKEVLDFLEEQEQIKNVGALNFLKILEVEYGDSKKNNTKLFLEHIREIRKPVMYKAFKELKTNLSSLRGSGIKTEYPKNLEGDTININFDIKSESDVDKVLKSLEKNRENLKRAINIVKKGG